MLEVDITDFMNNNNMDRFSNSIANSGREDIAQVTWKNACSLKPKYHFVTEENKQEFIDYFDEFGAWDDLETWPINQLNGLFVQYIAGEIKDLEMCDNWKDYEKLIEEGQTSGSLFQHENRVYFTLSH